MGNFILLRILVMKKENMPVFLSSSPKGEDELIGNSQEKVATTIVELIKENKLEKKVIGLEGEWGSGKSNIIEIIKNKIGSRFYTYVFDSWGNQEDLTRRTFLEELITKLFDKGFLSDEDKWKEKKNELLSNKSTNVIKVTPNIKSYWFYITISLFLYLVFSSFYELILIDYDVITSWNASYWKPFLSVYLIPTIFFIIGFCSALKEYYKEVKLNELKPKIEKLKKIKIASTMLYLFYSDKQESEETENIIKNDPTVRQFREYFELIQHDLKEKNKGLIIVFDNIDRLEDDKIKALWSSIHTFFAEKSYDNTWVIVPYFKEKLIKSFDDENERNGFISKTFSVNFRVPPPVVSAWDTFLKKRIKDAFGEKIIDKTELDFIIDLFDRLTLESTIKPRQVINYVNELVAMYFLWKEKIIKEEMKFRYLALFILVKDSILKDPINSILDRDYLGSSLSLFAEDDDLDEYISAIVFNVDKSLANEVLLSRELTLSIRNGDTSFIEKSKSNIAFNKYFRDSYESVDFKTKRPHLSKILYSVEEKFSKNYMSAFWENYAFQLLKDHKLKPDSQFLELNEEIKDLFRNVKNTTRTEILKAILNSISNELESDDDIQQYYYDTVKEIVKFFEDEKIKINVFSYLKNTLFNTEPFLEVLKKEKEKYNELKISFNKEDFVQYFYNNGGVIVENVYEEIENIEIVKDEIEIEEIENSIIVKLRGYNSGDSELIEKSLFILKKLKGEENRPLKISLSNNIYSTTNKSTLDESILYDCISIGISNFTDSTRWSALVSTLNNLEEEEVNILSNNIQWYISFKNLLALLVNNAASRQVDALKKVVSNIILNKYGIQLNNINWCLENFKKINEYVFDDDKQKISDFVNYLDSWGRYYNSSDFDNIDIAFFEFIGRSDLNYVKKIQNDALELIEYSEKEELVNAFEQKNKLYSILFSLVFNGLISKFNDSFYTAYDKYLDEVLIGNIEIPDDSFVITLLTSKLDGRKLRGTFSRVGEKIIENPQEIGVERISFFMDGVIKYGNLKKHPEKVTYKLIDYLFENEEDSINIIFSKYADFFTEIILNSGEYVEDAKTKITSEFHGISNEEVKSNLKKKLKLKIKNL